jgi:hypothetical protein
MDIDTPFRRLGEVDVSDLSEAILALDKPVWLENQHRQDSYVEHRETQSVVLVFCEGWPEVQVRKEPAWDYLGQVAVPVMHDLISRHYPPGGTIIRAMAAKLLSGGLISPHVDSHVTFHRSHRIHVPITTNDRVRFMIDGRPYQFEVGQAYELNNQKSHSVMNRGTDDRITFIFDYVPPDQIGSREPIVATGN